MKLPNGDQAEVDPAKLRDYCLNLSHPRGRHKARVFAAIGLTEYDADELREILLAGADVEDVAADEEDRYGQRYTMVISLDWRGTTARLRACWIIRRGEDFPRLTSCYLI